MSTPPPLLSSLPAATRVQIIVFMPALAGLVLGFLASESELGWWIANVVFILGGVGGGYEHVGAGSGARRGAIAGFCFGVGMVIGDAISAAAPIVGTPDPIVLFILLTTLGGTGLAAIGGSLRGRTEAAA